MEVFIKQYQYNYIKKMMKELRDAYGFCVDIDVINVSKSLIRTKIYECFSNLNKNQEELLDIEWIKGKLQTFEYIEKLAPYVHGMPNVTEEEIKKLFKKEKKLKIPELEKIDFSSLTYLGWRDKRTNSIYIVYSMENELVGIKCRTLNSENTGEGVCVLCNHARAKNESVFVTVVKKKSMNYHSIGFTICFDSETCNQSLTDVTKLEELIKKIIQGTLK